VVGAGLPGPKRLKMLNLAISSLKKGQILKNEKWPKGQTILFLANSFKKAKIGRFWHLKRPNGNPTVGDQKCGF